MLLRTITLLAALALCACTEGDDSWGLSALPPALGAEDVEFARNEAWGFGPGGNETGFTVVRLADDAVARLSGGGVTWLNAQPGGRLQRDWRPTPVPRDEFWMGRPDSAAGSYLQPTVLAVLHRYGFPIAVPDDHKTALDAALNAPGNFYAFGPGGLVAVLVPATGHAYVFHAG
jgi:hypothetical protein